MTRSSSHIIFAESLLQAPQTPGLEK